ncbi:uncharacterized protein [Periplaneta americana]|uniref:uncharacterized protein n=1 Tax=Periplaneta americana TaxID=6978 RepID=UPI0037E85099
MIPSCDGQTMSEYPLAGRLEDREVAGDSTTDKCAQCTRRQGEWCRQPFTQERRPARETAPITMSTRTLTGRSALAWTFLIVAALCCGVQAAPEAFHHRQGDSAVIIPPVDLHELEKLGLTENTEQDGKHREEMAALFELLQRWQQGNEDDSTGQDSAVPPALDGYPNLPFQLAIPPRFFRTQDGIGKDEAKRGSYQPPLCYFKICNMGRKRNNP